MTNEKHGHVAGEFMRYIRGHVAKRPHVFTAGVDWEIVDLGYETPCWRWLRSMWSKTGYGRYGGGPRLQLAHRMIYELYKGPIPAGLQLDHLCRNRACVNPDHLEPVTRAENLRRGRGTKITVEIVHEIRASNESAYALATRLGLREAHVYGIRSRRIWKDV